jgi:hypothetical protein
MTKPVNNCRDNGNSIACEDGCCPDCNYYEYLCWLNAHTHCDVGADCPDDGNCPHKKDAVWVRNSD